MKTIRFTETCLRDAHQSLYSTRLGGEQIIPVLEQLDQAGYDALECWGGATFDVCMRFLNEDPWERLRLIRKHVKNTRLMMLSRGQNLLGYANFPDDVVELFLGKAIENGIDIIRIFDALNDPRNLESSFKAIRKYGGHAQGAICYTTSPVHSIEYFARYAKTLEEMGADSLAIKDMAGILTPKNAFELVQAIKSSSKLDLELHTHATSGTGSMTLLKAVEAGCDIIDTAISPFSSGSSQPPTETMNIVLKEYGYQTGLDDTRLNDIADYFRKLRRGFENQKGMNLRVYEVNPAILQYQIPGGMLSNLLTQLAQSNDEQRLDEVMQEVRLVRSETGYPPLVTPMSQIIAAQAVANVLSGQRYLLVPQEMQDYLRGYYGQAPAPISEKIQQDVLQGEAPITCRPADLLEPGLPTARARLGGLPYSEEDVLSYAMFPETAEGFLSRKLTGTLLRKL